MSDLNPSLELMRKSGPDSNVISSDPQHLLIKKKILKQLKNPILWNKAT
jgi:hypothetical protein